LDDVNDNETKSAEDDRWIWRRRMKGGVGKDESFP
jgi:hypothetical protein